MNMSPTNEIERGWWKRMDRYKREKHLQNIKGIKAGNSKSSYKNAQNKNSPRGQKKYKLHNELKTIE